MSPPPDKTAPVPAPVAAETDTVEPRAPVHGPPAPLAMRPFIRSGVYAWSAIGLALLIVAVGFVFLRLTVVFVPLILALFPATVLVPPTEYLKRRGLPDAFAAAVTLVVFVALLAILGRALAPQVSEELGGLAESVEAGYLQLRAFLAAGPLGLPPLPLEELLANLREGLTAEGTDIAGRVAEALVVIAEGAAGLALLLISLFFYLKDGARIAAWVKNLFPERMREDVQIVGERAWSTIGAYIRGVMVIGLFDAVCVGIGLALLRIPLALPLAVLVFFGALFPIVGAFAAGGVAVLVALATSGPPAALAVLILIVAVQQFDGHIITPLMLGRATAMHPLGVLASLAAGGVLWGVLGAFLAVPVAASISRAVEYLRARTPG